MPDARVDSVQLSRAPKLIGKIARSGADNSRRWTAPKVGSRNYGSFLWRWRSKGRHGWTGLERYRLAKIKTQNNPSGCGDQTQPIRRSPERAGKFVPACQHGAAAPRRAAALVLDPAWRPEPLPRQGGAGVRFCLFAAARLIAGRGFTRKPATGAGLSAAPFQRQDSGGNASEGPGPCAFITIGTPISI